MKASADHAIMILPSIDKGKYAFRQQNISSAKDSVRTILCAEIQRVFREQMGQSAKADEAAGLTPGCKDDEAGCSRSPEQPRRLPFADGIIFQMPFAGNFAPKKVKNAGILCVSRVLPTHLRRKIAAKRRRHTCAAPPCIIISDFALE